MRTVLSTWQAGEKKKNLKGALNIQKTSNLPSVLEEKNASCIDYQTVSEDVA